MQESNTSDLIFGVEKIVSFLSQGTTIEKGTVILTGTPSVGIYTLGRETVRKRSCLMLTPIRFPCNTHRESASSEIHRFFCRTGTA